MEKKFYILAIFFGVLLISHVSIQKSFADENEQNNIRVTEEELSTEVISAIKEAATQGNTSPILSPIGNKTIEVLSELSFTVHAIDKDIPAQTVLYSIFSKPLGAYMNYTTGVFTWTPSEKQGPGDYTFDVAVTDGITTVIETITVTVTDSNFLQSNTNQQSSKITNQMENSEKPNALRPKFQQDNGISGRKILCEEGLELIQKTTDDSYACVISKTAEKLVLRGWGISPSQKISVDGASCYSTAQAWRQHFITVSVTNLDETAIDTTNLDVYVNDRKINPVNAEFSMNYLPSDKSVQLKIMYEEGDYLDHVEGFKVVKVVGPSNTGWDFWVC